jgi:hypothetical protein
MKRLVCATLATSLALSLVGATAASAQSYNRGGYDRGYSSYRGGHDNTGALIGLGIGLFAIGAIIASQHNNDRDRYDDRYQGNYAPAYQGGYQNGYQTNYQDRGGYQSGYRGNAQYYRGNGYDYGNR